MDRSSDAVAVIEPRRYGKAELSDSLRSHFSKVAAQPADEERGKPAPSPKRRRALVLFRRVDLLSAGMPRLSMGMHMDAGGRPPVATTHRPPTIARGPCRFTSHIDLMYTVIGLVGAAVNGGHGAGRACGLACARLPGRLPPTGRRRAALPMSAGALNPVYFLIFGWLVNDFGNLAANQSFDFMGQVQRQEAPPTHTPMPRG